MPVRRQQNTSLKMKKPQKNPYLAAPFHNPQQYKRNKKGGYRKSKSSIIAVIVVLMHLGKRKVRPTSKPPFKEKKGRIRTNSPASYQQQGHSHHFNMDPRNLTAGFRNWNKRF